MSGLILLAGFLAGCGPKPRVPPTSWENAQHDRTIRRMEVYKIWDQLGNRLEDGANPHVSHYVEVDVLGVPDSAPETQRMMTLPYDEWNVGRAPPEPGATVTAAPSDWLRRDSNSNGRPYGGW